MNYAELIEPLVKLAEEAGCTILDIYEKHSYDHKDLNTLHRVG